MALLTLILSFLVGALGIHYFFLQKWDHFKKLGILHIRPLPFFGNMAQAILSQRSLCDVMNDVYNLNEKAQYVGFYDFGKPVILIKSPELIKDITVKSFDHFMDHRTFVDEDLDPLFAKTLFTLRGEKWKAMRTLLSPSFTGCKMKHMFKLMSDCAKKLSHHFAENSVNVFNMKDAFTRYTNDVIAACAFGIDIDSVRNPNNDFYLLGQKAANLEGSLSVKFFLLRNFPTLAKWLNVKVISGGAEKFFTDIVKQTIESRKQKNITKPDMIQLMMAAREKTIGNRANLSILDMAAQAFNFFFGGYDTSSGLMCFVAHLIAVNDDVQKRLHDEVDEIMDKTNGEPTYEAVNEMQYLKAVILEALRLYPILIFHDRMCVKTFELPSALPGGKPTTIEPGQNLWFPVHSIHRDPKYFVNPDKFDPDRFMGNRKNDILPFTYFPFGQGPRKCIASRFVMLQVKVVMFHILAISYLKPSAKTRLPLHVAKSNVVIGAEGGFWLQIEPRTRS